MLHLTRRLGETVCIGNDITVTIVRTGNQVGLRIRAPKHVPVHREELFERLGPTLIHAAQSEPPLSASHGETLGQSTSRDACSRDEL